MPRVADHDQRRHQIALAFQRLLATVGFTGVTFAKVAAEAGVSVGLIQHYFSGKDALLRFAYDDALSGMSERVRARLTTGGSAPTGRVLFDCLAELLPLDGEREVEYRVRQCLRTQAMHDARLAEVARRSGGDILGYVSGMVEHGIERGEVGPEVDPVLAARGILATVQGLADQIALSGKDGFPAEKILRTTIATVFTTHGH
ncbi:transcriptional regulator [Prauserella marina]|uniref:DNA-binding transcriptional regulator, AcrR family n=1 Tax=Prauserella marina TaxID=530584 RepID=A0A222VS70_9PSEU|nr:TetR/AcrR family transcriptional regulator [Prauserella marina]ASR36748.1 transcriptional regulator [Prauserella marina]PWV80363.1 TetR family transcriptional regulator [Prauserella marina]SDD52683.1 DNA-binding transcriptional regulator, AcrR family [Prauserella marina]